MFISKTQFQHVLASAKSAPWAISSLLRFGIPRVLVEYGRGYGDSLLCSAVLHEFRRRGYSHLWTMSSCPEIFDGNPDVAKAVYYDSRWHRLTKLVGGRSFVLEYARYDRGQDRSAVPDNHIIAVMCYLAGIRGNIEIRPYFYLTDQERTFGALLDRQVAIQVSGIGARLHMLNKEWYHERFQSVVNVLSKEFQFVQVGSPNDPPLQGVLDMRGRTSIRETGAILSQSLMFVGLVGFLMHLARSVDCPAVIVYGGREAPRQSGYICNENLITPLQCSPCWLWNTCQYDRECMRKIEADHVISAIRRMASRERSPLQVEKLHLESKFTAIETVKVESTGE